jgi:hypothetical protein
MKIQMLYFGLRSPAFLTTTVDFFRLRASVLYGELEKGRGGGDASAPTEFG